MDEGHEARPLRSEKVLRTAPLADRGKSPRSATRLSAIALVYCCFCKVLGKRQVWVNLRHELFVEARPFVPTLPPLQKRFRETGTR